MRRTDALPARSPGTRRRSRGRLPALLLLLFFGTCSDPAPVKPLEAVLDEIVARQPEAVVAVSVRDAATGTRLDRLPDRPFHAASTMKVPVMIEVYRQAALGRFRLSDSLTVRNAFRSIVDGSPYRIEDDSDDALYERLGTRMALRDLVDRMITVSSNLATNLLIDVVSADSVQATVERLGGHGMRVLRGVEDLAAYRQGLNNVTTAPALAALLEALAAGRAVSPEADREMIGILLEQRFNEMIPAGLPAGTRVAHKTGWITGIHHDAAIVYPAGDAPYVLVILIEGIEDPHVAATLGADIARAVHTRLRGGVPVEADHQH
ncbi:class A beta-lactamase-related serine hydrolase [Rhodocaloribacter litoris]|uniref:serine hydrolase n=1 Tax=Rhodocaloribacter litoris TaxID=2558931 RepID=UPI00142232FC|nr:serine hydrolase [Rhodocaloribacter litoris]QXD17072.1 class A beta-lactamase-related serine hydrolase [Rhodocaloribacter litoris]